MYKLIVEIFKPERGSLYTSGRFVAELPLFSTNLNWIYIDEVISDYVLDVYYTSKWCPLLSSLPLKLIELCNKQWDKCVSNNMDFISFEYEYD